MKINEEFKEASGINQLMSRMSMMHTYDKYMHTR